jgi:hypothetical protein
MHDLMTYFYFEAYCTTHDSITPHKEPLSRKKQHFLLVKRGHLGSLKYVAEFKKESKLIVFINVSVPEHALLLWYVHDGGLISRGLKSTVDYSYG